MVTNSENMSQANFDLGLDDTIAVVENGVKILRNPVLSFMHAWYMGDDANSIMRNAVTSFSIDQLEAATKLLRSSFPACGTFTKHRTSDKFVNDIMGGFKILGDLNEKVEYICSSVDLRKVKASTILFSEDEPVVAVQMRDMKKEISDMKEAQATLFKLLDERLPEKNDQNPATTTFKGIVEKHNNSILKVPKPFEKASHLKPPARKRANSEIDESIKVSSEDDTDDGWEQSREDKRREKIRKRNKEKKEKEIEKESKDDNKDNLTRKKKTPLVVCTGTNNGKDSSFQGEAAPRNVFVSRTAKGTTKDNVEACLEYFTGIKGIATCVTPEERLQTAFSLSWRVEVPAVDLQKALEATSWVTGWAVREYFFPRVKKSSKPAKFEDPTKGGQGVSSAAKPRFS